MYPVLFEIGGFEVTSFGVMMVLAFLSGAWLLSIQLDRRGIDSEIAWEVLAWLAVGGIVGAKLYYLGLQWRAVLADPVGMLTSRAGLVWYGGLIGGVLAYYWQIRRLKLPMGTMFDAAAPALAFSYAVGRIGCLLVGDDYGLPTDSAVGIAFPDGAPPSTAGYFRSIGTEVPAEISDAAVLAVHPTQLYEAAAGLIMFAILWRMSARKLVAGQLFGLFLVLYGIERFLIEFVRAKTDHVLFGLTTSQIASFIALGLGIYLWNRGRRQEPSDRPQPARTAAGAS